MGRSRRRWRACWRGVAGLRRISESTHARCWRRAGGENYLDHIARQEAQGAAPPAPPARGYGRARAHGGERPGRRRRAQRLHGARSRRLERPRRRRGARACGDRSVHARGRHRARREGRCAHRPAHSRRPSGRGVDHAAQRQRARGSGRSPTTRRSRARRRACSSRSISPRDLLADAALAQTDSLRHRRSSDDRSSVERAPDALRPADRAERGIDGAIPHRAAARSVAARRHRGGEEACATG